MLLQKQATCTEKSNLIAVLFISLCLTMWVCLKQGSENMVLVVLLRIGAKDLTVLHTRGQSVACMQIKKNILFLLNRSEDTLTDPT